jgi:hypothetical protein
MGGGAAILAALETLAGADFLVAVEAVAAEALAADALNVLADVDFLAAWRDAVLREAAVREDALRTVWLRPALLLALAGRFFFTKRLFMEPDYIIRSNK